MAVAFIESTAEEGANNRGETNFANQINAAGSNLAGKPHQISQVGKSRFADDKSLDDPSTGFSPLIKVGGQFCDKEFSTKFFKQGKFPLQNGSV